MPESTRPKLPPVGDNRGKSERAEACGPELTGAAVRRSAAYDASKRLADIVLAGIALTLSLPFWIWAAIAVLLTDGWPVLYSQTRVGRGGRIFSLYKFRSMIKDAETHTGPVLSGKDDWRITRIGRIMRKTAVDEIPQLISIFRGDMSWAGPRPERPEFVRDFLRDIPGY